MRHSSRRSRTETPLAPTAPDGRLSGVRALKHDDDERASREDLTYGETLFNRGVVPLPRFLTRRRKPPRQ